MKDQQSTSTDPMLQRLHDLTERIRHRAAEDRARREARTRRHGQRELPLHLTPLPPRRAAPVPRHWSDGRDEEQSAA
jgi:hypothetical protein